jgi:hypothetical protein
MTGLNCPASINSLKYVTSSPVYLGGSAAFLPRNSSVTIASNGFCDSGPMSEET